MRRWAVPVMIVFWLMLAASLGPLQQMALPPRGEAPPVSPIHHPLVQLWTVLLLAAQAVLLIRIRPDGERPTARRKLWPAALAAAFCLALLSSGLLLSLALAGAGDQALAGIGKVFDTVERHTPGAHLGRWFPMLLVIGFIAGMWTGWWILLGPLVRNAAPQSLTARLVHWILAGSVLELLIAVPCHVICRRREDCCAPILTFWGMATGWALLLLSLGPAAALLIQRRMARKQSRAPAAQ